MERQSKRRPAPISQRLTQCHRTIAPLCTARAGHTGFVQQLLHHSAIRPRPTCTCVAVTHTGRKSNRNAAIYRPTGRQTIVSATHATVADDQWRSIPEYRWVMPVWVAPVCKLFSLRHCIPDTQNGTSCVELTIADCPMLVHIHKNAFDGLPLCKVSFGAGAISIIQNRVCFS